MPNLFMAYDLIAPGQRYPAVEKAIQGLGTACKLLNTTWYVKTAMTMEQAHNAVWAVMDANDKLLTVEASNATNGNLPAACWKTINEQWSR